MTYNGMKLNDNAIRMITMTRHITFSWKNPFEKLYYRQQRNTNSHCEMAYIYHLYNSSTNFGRFDNVCIDEMIPKSLFFTWLTLIATTFLLNILNTIKKKFCFRENHKFVGFYINK